MDSNTFKNITNNRTTSIAREISLYFPFIKFVVAEEGVNEFIDNSLTWAMLHLLMLRRFTVQTICSFL